MKNLILLASVCLINVLSFASIFHLDSTLILNPKNESDSIKQTVQKYYSASNAEEVLPFIVFPDSLKNTILKFYSSEDWIQSSIPSTNITITGSNFKKGDYITVAVQRTAYSKRKLLLIKTEKDYKIDVAASYGFNTISLTGFISSGDTHEKTFRFEVELLNRYFYDNKYLNKTPLTKENFISLNILDMNGNAFAWVEKKSDAGKKLFDLLQDGGTHRVILMIKNSESKSKNEMENEKKGEDAIIVTNFLQDGWIKK